VTVEDGVIDGGVGARIGQRLSADGVDVPVRHLGVPTAFPQHGSVADVRAWAGLTVPAIGRRIVEWCASTGPAVPGSPATAQPGSVASA
jgi:1-deoxy-D-xylulose-5-phosphate synthase